MKDSNKVQKIIEWFSKFDNKNILIKSKNIEFDIKIDKNGVCHLLGLQYMNKNPNVLKGARFFNYIIYNNLSDNKILNQILKNNPNMLKAVIERINTFEYFMKNLEKGYIVENKNITSSLNNKNFILQFEDNGKILHLGVSKGEYSDNFSGLDIEYDFNKYLNTYFSRKDNKYFKNTNIFEKIEGIYEYIEDELKPFSFNEEKNKNIDDDGNIPNNDEISSFRIKDDDELER